MSPSRRKISLQRVAHVSYAHADAGFDKACEFLRDFGMVEADAASNSSDRIYFKGYGVQPYIYCATRADKDEFLGTAFVVDSMDDLELAKDLPHATDIQKLETPGGGYGVSFKEPVDGFPFHLVYGQQLNEPSGEHVELSYNFPNSKHRAVNKTQRFKKGPAAIHKLGHFGVCTTNYDALFEFMTTNFNFKPTDTIYLPESNKDITTFMHLDRGKEWVDHHTFFFYQGPKPHVHHASFEVHDFDTQLLGHHWLEEKKYDLVWGVGRHVLGSQIFDYWYDPSRFILEHYVDGDLVNDETPTGRNEAAPDNLHVWDIYTCLGKKILWKKKEVSPGLLTNVSGFRECELLGPEVPATFLD